MILFLLACAEDVPITLTTPQGQYALSANGADLCIILAVISIFVVGALSIKVGK